MGDQTMHRGAMIDAGIVGCGTAGAAAALFLARAGHRTTVYEAVAEPEAVGAGIMLQPTGQHVLARLGLLDTVASRAAQVRSLRCETETGRGILDLHYGEVDPRLVGLGVHRGLLFQTLFDAVRATPSIDLHLGTRVASLVRTPGRTAVVDSGGATLGDHDLVVVADGARSQLRDDVPWRVRAEPYPWGALWFVANDPDHQFQGRLYQVVRGARQMLGLLPSGLGPRGDTDLVSLFWSIEVSAIDAWREAGLTAFRDQALALCPAAAPVLEQIADPERVRFAPYWDVVMPRWHDRTVVYLGDAGHATSPQLGQGANLALWDAMVLSDTLAGSDGGSVAALLDAYSRQRRSHLRYYGWATRSLTPWFQSRSVARGWLRDRMFGVLGAVPVLRRQMIRTMLGVKRGILRRSFPLAPLLEHTPAR